MSGLIRPIKRNGKIIAFGRTAEGQKAYDFLMSRMSVKRLAQKYGMSEAEAARIRDKGRRIMNREAKKS